MPQLEQLWKENQDKGLHIFHVERQGSSADQIRDFVKQRRLTFPQTLGGDFSKYEGGNGLPYAFVIGVDGKVLWQGRSGYKQVIHEELKKVLYPGLGKREVSKELVKSARLFAAKKFAKSLSEAKEELEKLEGEESGEIAQEARYIISRIEKLGKLRQDKATQAKSEKEYFEAYRIYRELAVQYSGHEIGDLAKSAYKEMDSDSKIKKEVKAEQTLLVLLSRLEKEYDLEKKRLTLEAFAKQYEGMTAGRKAKEEAASIGH